MGEAKPCQAMWAFQLPSSLQKHLNRHRAAGNSIGFVPTMGALHEGHLSLVRQSNAEAGFTVCSIFVNPTQFNDASDLSKYPRTEGEDLFQLERAHCDAVFLPSEEEVYPSGLDSGPVFEFGPLDKAMEGEFRPGHFKGVAQVVHRLLQIVSPDAIYMGQKDFQQVAIVREMIRQAGLKVRLVMCPTIREKDGLAMSSRNVRLSEGQRLRAGLIYRQLEMIRENAGSEPLADLEKRALQSLASEPGFRPEYVRIVDGKTLRSVGDYSESDFIVACVATWVGEVRLIDNVVIKYSGEE